MRPETDSQAVNDFGKLCALNPHAQFDEGRGVDQRLRVDRLPAYSTIYRSGDQGRGDGKANEN